MIEKTSTVDMIGFDALDKGDIAIRIIKLTRFEGEIIKSEYHRALVQPGDDLEATLTAVNADLIRQGFTEIDAEGLAAVRAEAARRWTPQRIAKRQKRDEDAVKRLNGDLTAAPVRVKAR